MTNNRKNNSILFLTTLGVYLGLMLVGGAAPQVFAHGALARNFELQDEIEVSARSVLEEIVLSKLHEPPHLRIARVGRTVS